MTSLNCFSQNGQDSTKIQLTRPIAEVVAKGLVRYDGLTLEVGEIRKELNLINSKVLLKDEIIFNLNSKVTNLETIILKKDEQFALERKKSEELIKELKGQQRKTFLFKIGTYIGVGATILLLAK